MVCTVNTDMPNYAPVDSFELLRGKVLCGSTLQAVKRLQENIVRYGLLSPIVAIERAGQLVVVDGRKRLAAIRRLSFEGRLPRSLVKIPYILVSEMRPSQRRGAIIMASEGLFKALCQSFQRTRSIQAISEEFQISDQCVRDILSLSRLAPTVRDAVFKAVISFGQAKAYAALPSQSLQTKTLARLGPFAKPQQIIDQADLYGGDYPIAA